MVDIDSRSTKIGNLCHYAARVPHPANPFTIFSGVPLSHLLDPVPGTSQGDRGCAPAHAPVPMDVLDSEG